MKKLKGKIQFLLVVIVILFITYLTIFGENGILKIRKIKQETEKVKVTGEKIKGDNERIKKEIKLLQEDERYVGKVAREELGMSRKDEIIFKRRKVNDNK